MIQGMTVQTITRDGFTISYIDEQEFEDLWEEIFRVNQYIFTCKIDAPFIIDCGAHIGMSVLYFKRRFPHSQIIAFEPNPQSFQILEQNINQNHLQNVQLINAAVTKSDGPIPLYVRQDSLVSWGNTTLKGAIVGPEQQWCSINSHSVRLSSYITRSVDYLKLDIEGMEETVLREIEEKLPLISEIRIEFHCNSLNEENDIERTLTLLNRHNFKYAFERFRKVITIDEVRRGMRHSDPYQFIIYVHRSKIRILWQSWFVPRLIRLKNRVRRSL